MRTTGALIHNELLQQVRAKETFWILIVLPILLILILGNALAGLFDVRDRQIGPVEVGVVVLDEAADGMAGSLLAEDGSKWLTIRSFEDRAQMRAALKAGEIGYGVVVPERFTEDVKSGRQAVWELYPGKDRDRNLVAESVLEGALSRMNFIQSATMTLGPQAAGRAAQGVLTPAESRVDVTSPNLTGGQYSALQYYAAHMLVMFLLFAGMSAGLSIVGEREKLTLARIYAAPVRPFQLLTGKIVGNGAIAFGQAAIIIAFTRIAYGVDWGDRYVHLLAVTLLTVASSVSLAVIVAALAPKARTVQAVFMTLIILMTLLSGGFAPEIGTMLDQWGKFTLNYWAVQSYIRLMLDSADKAVRGHLAALGLITAGLILISALLGRKAVSRE